MPIGYSRRSGIRVRRANTLREVYLSWLTDAVFDVWNVARYFVSGILLNSVSGRLKNSIFNTVDSGTMTGQVGTNLDYGKTWELDGVQGPLPVKPGSRAIAIQKGLSAKGGILGSTTRFRQATYTRTSSKPPVRFLRSAIRDQMTGPIGRERLRDLGADIGRLVARRYVQRLAREYPEGVVIVREGGTISGAGFSNLNDAF